MAVSKFKTWVAGEILTASDLNNSFDQVFNNGEDLGWPRTKAADLNGQAFILDADGDSQLVESSDDIIGLQLTGAADMFLWDGATAGGALVNGLTFEAQTTGNDPRIVAQGSDTNIGIEIVPKGSGVVTISGLSINIVDDTTPQLGGDLDCNSFDIQFDDATGIRDNSDNETLIFQSVASAVNYVDLFNAATTGAPKFLAAGGDTNIDLDIGGKGTGKIAIVDGADNTKRLLHDVSGITTATNRTVTWPDASGTIIYNIVEDTTPQLGGALDANGNAINMGDNDITRPVFTDYAETVNVIGSTGGGTQSIDLTLGNVATLTVDTSANTFTFDNPSASGDTCTLTLIITNGGSQTVNWPASVDWAGGSAPTLTAAGRDVLTFVTVDGGTIWYGFTGGLNFS